MRNSNDKNKSDAKTLLPAGKPQPDKALPAAGSAAFTMLASQMLNLDGALNKQRLNPCCYALRGSGLEGIFTQGSATPWAAYLTPHPGLRPVEGFF